MSYLCRWGKTGLQTAPNDDWLKVGGVAGGWWQVCLLLMACLPPAAGINAGCRGQPQGQPLRK